MKSDEVLLAQAIKELRAQIAVSGALFKHVIDDDEQRMRHSDECPFATAAVHEVARMCLEVAVFFVAGGPGCLDQGLS